MDRLERVLIWADLEKLTVDYWHEVDTNWGQRAHEFFVEDGIFQASNDTAFLGRKEIQNFYTWRQSRGARVARHLISNFRVNIEDENHATTNWVLCLYAADGSPILPSLPPILIADSIDVCIRGDDGAWRYVSRTLKSLFAGGASITIPAPAL